MDILIINGSSRGGKGITGFLLDHFIAGAGEAGANTEVIELSREKIHHCMGCFHCWMKADREECLRDGKDGDTMANIRPRIAAAENLVLATPIYADGMTGLMKNAIDRMIPTMEPFYEYDENGELAHPPRSLRIGKKIVLLSTCGYPDFNNFAPLVMHVERIVRNMRSELVGKVLRQAGMILPYKKFLGEKYDLVVEAVKKAGREFATDGSISPETEKEVSIEIIDNDMFLVGAKMFWEKAIADGKIQKW